MALQELRIATSLTDRFWMAFGFLREGYRWLNEGLQSAGDDIPKLMKAKALYCLTRLSGTIDPVNTSFDQCIALCREIRPQADRELCLALTFHSYAGLYQSVSYNEEAVQIARSMGNAVTWELGESLYWYSLVLSLHPQGAYDDLALAAAEESLQINRTGDRWNAGGYWVKGMINTHRGQFEQARQSLEMALELSDEVGDLIGKWFSRLFLIWHHLRAGRYQIARCYYKELCETVDAVGSVNIYPYFVYSSGMLLASSLNDPLKKWDPTAGMHAVRLLGFTDEFVDQYGWGWPVRFRPGDQQALEQLREKLREDAYSQAWEEGRELTIEQAVLYALEEYK